MESDLSNQINIGKDTEKKLIQVGINSFENLVSLGAEDAFRRVRVIDPGACLSFLYGLEGAIEGIKWNKISHQRKKELQEFIKIINK
ncbi:MAG: TfoX/Sxy family protein [Bacteroidales bacterium]|jgi:DNA transformation protein